MGRGAKVTPTIEVPYHGDLFQCVLSYGLREVFGSLQLVGVVVLMVGETEKRQVGDLAGVECV